MRLHLAHYSREISWRGLDFQERSLERSVRSTFLQEKAEGEQGHDFQTGLGVILSWHEYQGATITAAQKLR